MLDERTKKILRETFPNIRENYELKNISWFQVGGKADFFYKPKNETDLKNILKLCLELEVPVFVLGVASNLIIRDGGIRGLVIRLGREFAKLEYLGEQKIYAGAACLDVNLANFAREHAIANLEFFSGIPGTIGGAIKMNAGAYGGETSQVLIEAYAYDLAGNKHILKNADLNFSYRKSSPKLNDLIFVGAVFQGVAGDEKHIAEKIAMIQNNREESQPIRERTGGSTFKNPEGHSAWKLIDESGCRGLKLGGAMISDKHCNFMLNLTDAKASELEELGNLVRAKVKERTGVALNWEIKIIGEQS